MQIIDEDEYDCLEEIDRLLDLLPNMGQFQREGVLQGLRNQRAKLQRIREGKTKTAAA